MEINFSMILATVLNLSLLFIFIYLIYRHMKNIASLNFRVTELENKINSLTKENK